MQDSRFSRQAEDAQSRPLRSGSGTLPIFPKDTNAGEATDPLASEGPFLKSSEWPSSSELESALIESDPFPTNDVHRAASVGDIDLFGELEPPLPRDTVPSPPPVAEELPRVDLPKNHRIL